MFFSGWGYGIQANAHREDAHTHTHTQPRLAFLVCSFFLALLGTLWGHVVMEFCCWDFVRRASGLDSILLLLVYIFSSLPYFFFVLFVCHIAILLLTAHPPVLPDFTPPFLLWTHSSLSFVCRLPTTEIDREEEEEKRTVRRWVDSRVSQQTGYRYTQKGGGSMC
ncbi:hypothetical protein B0T18DRAFT_417428 [Schizothecium vesticola]|uniref:Uncharacterized protein n=1 Tax=Schizothecium vesticola TaxID=314040 RepID=A0AA40EIZ3_9PEZI|nr:hypothetical protein B0T18DRAFT_417428 [Schizothecium vesticola]